MEPSGGDEALVPSRAGVGRGWSGAGRSLRLDQKALPTHARGHNRALVLQTLYAGGEQSRADVARTTGLTRVTISDLVAGLIAEGLIVEKGQREIGGPGKPATLIDIDSGRFQIIGIDLSAFEVFRGAVLDLDGAVLERAEIPLAGSTGDDATTKVRELVGRLVRATTAPLLGIGVGSPGIVDSDGVIQSAPNLGWSGEPLQALLAAEFGAEVVVVNDANAAVLAEHSFGGADGDMILVKIGHGVGAGLLLGGSPLFGSRFAAGEIGHVVVGTDGGELCSCGKRGCLETWLATPRLDALLAGAPDGAARERTLADSGRRLGIALAPVVGALNLPEIVLSGPVELLEGAFADAALATLRERTMAEFHSGLVLRMASLGGDIVMRGAADAVLSRELGFS